MKEIIYNNDNVCENEINNELKRAKIVIENDNGELLLVFSNNNYFLLGGHIENNESDKQCIIREVIEESGVLIPFSESYPFMKIRYYCRNYPKDGLNTKYTNNYYFMKYNLVPDISNTSLTEDEKNGNFRLEYINKKDVVNVLEKSLDTARRRIVVRDTIDVIKEYLRLDNKKHE